MKKDKFLTGSLKRAFIMPTAYWGASTHKGAEDAYLDMTSDTRPDTKNVYEPGSKDYWSKREQDKYSPE